MENKTLSVDSVSARKRTCVDVDNEESSLKLRKTQSDIDDKHESEDDKIWENLKPGTLMRVRKTVEIEELRKNTLLDGNVKINITKHGTMDYEWNLTDKNIVMLKPCGHVCMCRGCVQDPRVTKCPICRAQISEAESVEDRSITEIDDAGGFVSTQYCVQLLD